MKYVVPLFLAAFFFSIMYVVWREFFHKPKRLSNHLSRVLASFVLTVLAIFALGALVMSCERLTTLSARQSVSSNPPLEATFASWLRGVNV